VFLLVTWIYFPHVETLLDFKDKYLLEKARWMGMRLWPQTLNHHFGSVRKCLGWKSISFDTAFENSWGCFTKMKTFYHRPLQKHIIMLDSILCVNTWEGKPSLHFPQLEYPTALAGTRPLGYGYQEIIIGSGSENRGDFECCRNPPTRMRQGFGERPCKGMVFAFCVYGICFSNIEFSTLDKTLSCYYLVKLYCLC